MPTVEPREAAISLDFAPHARLESFTAHEALSELFVIEAIVRTEEDFDFFPHLGASATVFVCHDGEVDRCFNGRIWEARFLDVDAAGFRYRLTLRPWLYALTRNRDSAIYQELSATSVVAILLQERGMTDVDYSKLEGDAQIREYCVQYRESDFTFISRLLEQEGIYYYFRHDDGAHTLVLANARSSHPNSSYGDLPYIVPTGGAQTYAARFWTWTERVTSGVEGKVKLRDWDFTKPGAPVEGEYASGHKLENEKAEVYDYPGYFLDTSLGNDRAKTILESDRGARKTYRGEGDASALACGEIFRLARHRVGRFNQEYIIARLDYAVANQQFRSGGDDTTPPSQVQVEVIPADTPWRAPMLTPWPIAHGPETAIVTGPQGETIYTDKFGRVKVRFHWDRSGSEGDKTTCFIRVSASSAGQGFGHLALPRIGQEVVVDFLDGDPDRPLIVGRVYNAHAMEAYALPDNKTRSVWRSQTIGQTGQDYAPAENPPAGGGAGWNEISMEDTSGKELLLVQAQRDRETTVRRDDKFTLGRDQTHRVGHDRSVAIKNDDTLSIEQGNMSIDVKLGDYSLKTDAGSVKIEAMQQITLTVGQNSIKIDQTGITLSGLNIQVQAQVALSAQAPQVSLDGEASMSIAGGVVMIN